MKTITPKTHTIVSIMIFTFCFFASMRAAEESGESRVAELVNTPSSISIAQEVVNLPRQQQELFLNQALTESYFTKNGFIAATVCNQLAKKKDFFKGYEPRLTHLLKQLGPLPERLKEKPIAHYWGPEKKETEEQQRFLTDRSLPPLCPKTCSIELCDDQGSDNK